MTLSGVDSNRGWLTLWHSGDDTHTGSWQQDVRVSVDGALTFSPFYACTTLIASDIGKVCLRLMEPNQGVWVEAPNNGAFSPVLRKPNHYQTRQQFIECWVLSKLLHGNAYILKIRDARRVVIAMYVLPPDRVTPLVATNGSVFYDIRRDDLSKVPVDMPAIPASEIIHDRMECLFHPLVGIPPLIASALASSQGMRIQRNSEWFFKNMSRPGGMLTAPDHIDDETANRLKEEFEKNFSGEKMGRLFVGGDGLTFSATAIPAEQSQLVEQLKLSAEQVCMAFHVPAYMIGAGAAPSYNNVEALNQQYYTQCLQKFLNAIEDLLDEGLGLLPGHRCEFDLDELLRMDTATRMDSVNKAIAGGWMAPNEGRARFGMLPVTGGESPMMQQQNWNLEQLAEREAPADTGTTAAPPAPTAEEEAAAKEEARALLETIQKGFADASV
jgi:HK97 family phage portal protein